MRTLVLIALTSSLLGCTYEDGRGHHHQGSGGGSSTAPDPAVSTIDTGASLADMVPGEGVGAFAEYQAGGTWHIYTTCDTAISKLSCRWDIILSAASADEIFDFAPDRLESSDYLDWEDDRSVRMVTRTTTDFDGFFVEAQPGAPMLLDVYLDGRPEPRYIYWVGDGGLHQGSPTNPIELVPSAP
ncbi:MAG: hypothetical protein KF718_19415 [Polyangiaceae bacterium]|nr:hypothetical protein [Polyangiaceae bacterium]